VLFTGEYEHTIDAKQRVAIPSDIRARLEAERLSPVFYVAPGPNGATWLWPERTFEEMAGAMERSLLPAGEMMEFEELLFSQSRRLEMDKAGRIRLPERLLAEAGLGQNVVILGVKDHLELRDPEQWRDERSQKLAKQKEIMLRARQAHEQHRIGRANGTGGGT
jgi:MraZ protein